MIDLTRFSPTLTPDQRGIWTAAGSVEPVSYPAEGSAACLAVEDGSFWFGHRNRCIVAAIERHAPAATLFDIGGGNGFVAQAVAGTGRDVVLVEPSPVGAANARRRGLANVVCATLDGAGLLPAKLPAVGVFDVVEHVQDDAAFVRRLHQLLQPAGHLFATVPAYPALWSDEDVAAGHFRRYTRQTLEALVEACGFDLRYSTMFFRPLPLPILLMRALPHRLGWSRKQSEDAIRQRDHATGGGILASVLERVLAPEVAHVRAGREMRFGASILLVAQRRS